MIRFDKNQYKQITLRKYTERPRKIPMPILIIPELADFRSHSDEDEEKEEEEKDEKDRKSEDNDEDKKKKKKMRMRMKI